MKKSIAQDRTKRKLVSKFEIKRNILKSIATNNNLMSKTRWSARLKLSDIFVNSSKTRIVKRCLLTGRKSTIAKSYRFSRLVFLRLARNGLITGLKKSSW